MLYATWCTKATYQSTVPLYPYMHHYLSIEGCMMATYLIYCKRGYFRWGKISQKCLQDISRGGNFHDTAPISFIKADGFYFHVGGNFREED